MTSISPDSVVPPHTLRQGRSGDAIVAVASFSSYSLVALEPSSRAVATASSQALRSGKAIRREIISPASLQPIVGAPTARGRPLPQEAEGGTDSRPPPAAVSTTRGAGDLTSPGGCRDACQWPNDIRVRVWGRRRLVVSESIYGPASPATDC